MSRAGGALANMALSRVRCDGRCGESTHAESTEISLEIDDQWLTVIEPGGSDPGPGPRFASIATPVTPAATTAAPAMTYQRAYQGRAASPPPAASAISSG